MFRKITVHIEKLLSKINSPSASVRTFFVGHQASFWIPWWLNKVGDVVTESVPTGGIGSLRLDFPMSTTVILFN